MAFRDGGNVEHTGGGGGGGGVRHRQKPLRGEGSRHSNKLGFGLRALITMSDELKPITPRHLMTLPESAMLRLMERLPTVTDASRELFVRRLAQRLDEVSGALRAAAGAGSRYSPKAHASFRQVYRFGQTLGSGAFGHVFMGQRKADGLLVAIKAFNKPEVRGKGNVLLVQDERNLLGALRGHPFLLNYESSLHTRHNLLLLMELAVGGDLFKVMAAQPGKRFTEPVARFFIAQLVRSALPCSTLSIHLRSRILRI